MRERPDTAARLAFAAQLDCAMQELEISDAQLARMFLVRSDMVSSWRSVGLTPQSRYYLPLYEEFGLDPESFGFTRASLPTAKTFRPRVVPPAKVPSDFGRLIARARKRSGMRQQDLGTWCGLHLTTISKIETGKALPMPPALRKICLVLGLDEEKMLDLYDEQRARQIFKEPDNESGRTEENTCQNSTN